MSNLQLVKQNIESVKEEFELNAKQQKLSINFQKEAAFALQIFQSNDYLTKMSPESVKNAVLNISLTGITLNPVLKLAYLVPRKGKCVLDFSYMGLVKILTDTGSVKNIEANVVYWGEPFKLSRGTNPYIEHGLIEDPKTPKGEIRGAYSVATLNDGSKSIEWMDANELMAIMQRSESVRSGKNSPWISDTPEMCRKTVIKRHYKYLPKSERAIIAATAIEIDHENNGIDFEAENNSPQNVVVDLINPNDQAVIDKFSPMLDAINNPVVPAELFAPQTKEQFIESFKAEFMSGSMPVSKADGIYNTILGYFHNN